MRLIILTWTVIVLSLAATNLQAQDTREPDRLFRSNDVLDVTITAPLKTLMSERPKEEELPATFSYVDEDGSTIDFNIAIRTRGNYRHQQRICPFAPIRLNFDKAETKGTLFAKQDKLKLVAHCRNSSERYQQVTYKEYLAYRFFNELTEQSFRVRMLRITYVDTDRGGKESVYHGFVIEHRDRMAKRLGLPHIRVKNTAVGALNAPYTNLMSIFQYYIANTDFSPIAGAPDDFCCHNTNLFGNPGEAMYPIPYDFDMAGMTDAPYATPNAKFKIRTVRQRLYRGRCANNEHIPATLALFRLKRDTFVTLVEEMELLSNSSRKSMLSLMNSFDKLIDNPKAVERKISSKCI